MLMHLDFENIQSIPENIVHYYLGFTKNQFEQLLSEVPRLSNKHRGAFALAAYLLKLRTGDSDERIAALLQVPRSTLEGLMNTARELLNQDFVPRNLGLNNISRAEIAQRNLMIPNGLYGGQDRSPIIIADGTYIYIEKSSNYLYQKKTYSLHKYRNLVKPFLFVCCDGYIIDVLGPYPATTTDADIINQEFRNEDSPCRQFFQAGDVFILDRGFRDALPLLNSCDYQVHVPLSPEDGESQLTTSDANKSRAVTLCRWVVEVVNGIFKTAFKIFRQNYFNRASKHLMIDFAVAAALINRFHCRIQDREDAAQILEIVHQNMNTNNELSDYVRQQNLNRARANFQNINVNSDNVTGFPTLTYSDLILIACGTYQLKQARSYYGEHIRFNGCYRIEVCRERRRITDATNFGPDCHLIRARIASRHVSRKIYFVYIIVNDTNTGRAAIKGYCCTCIVGRRTVGCCAHVMTVIWFLGWARHQHGILPPAQFLDDVLVVYDDTNV
ncbi:hypothetical protein ABMA28_011356 [Loxostege sticticalis]|uniref:SWIM-type domain-containing protein n=1 Tax=Loxostege sticticalis TaxID=481309 RepID=A0ABD0S724_LOXSC